MNKIQGEKFKRFIEDSRPGVCRRIMHRFNLSEDDAEDIYQESAIALYNNIDTDINVSLDRFFSGIWYRQALKFLRDHKRTDSYDESVTQPHTGISMRKVDEIIKTMTAGHTHLQQPDEAFDHQQMKERVGKALDAMAQRCRQLLTLYYLEGYSWAELALHFDLKNADSAKSAANRCRRRFEEKNKELEIYIKG